MSRPPQPMCARCHLKPKFKRRCYCQDCGKIVAANYKRTYSAITKMTDAEHCNCSNPNCNGLTCETTRPMKSHLNAERPQQNRL